MLISERIPRSESLYELGWINIFLANDSLRDGFCILSLLEVCKLKKLLRNRKPNDVNFKYFLYIYVKKLLIFIYLSCIHFITP